jgi:hypothetical protein
VAVACGCGRRSEMVAVMGQVIEKKCSSLFGCVTKWSVHSLMEYTITIALTGTYLIILIYNTVASASVDFLKIITVELD